MSSTPGNGPGPGHRQRPSTQAHTYRHRKQEATTLTWWYEQGPSHSPLPDTDPLHTRGHVPPLDDAGGQGAELPEALSQVSSVHRDAHEQWAAHVGPPEPVVLKDTALSVFSSVSGLSITNYTVTVYLSCWRPSGTGRMLHNKPMASIPSYVPPKLMSSATAKRS